MATKIELAAGILSSHASMVSMTTKELIKELGELYGTLDALDKGEPVAGTEEAVEARPTITMRKAFGVNKVTCMICGKKMKTLARHLKAAHQMTSQEYRKEFGIPRTQPLAASAYSEKRAKMARDLGLGENLAKARAARRQAAKRSPRGSQKKEA